VIDAGGHLHLPSEEWISVATILEIVTQEHRAMACTRLSRNQAFAQRLSCLAHPRRKTVSDEQARTDV